MTLDDVAIYINKKIDITEIKREQYIATDNMFKDKLGVYVADIFPKTGKVIKFEKDDILISNIRPYFKKIWKATFDGGCSQDVLVFRSKDTKILSANALYSILADDCFFKYVMLAPKGSKMPRGDKEHIMRYKIDLEKNNNEIGDILYKIVSKIEKNDIIFNKYNELLKSLYYFHFDSKNINSSNFSEYDQKHVFNFNNIPECEILKTGIDVFSGYKNYLATANVNEERISDGKYIEYINREGRANMQPMDNSIWFAKMKDSIKHIGIPSNSKWFKDKYILSTGFCGIRCSELLFPYIYTFISFDNFENQKNRLAHGDTQQAINGSDLDNIYIFIPNKEELKKFSDIANKILKYKFNLIKENQYLYKLRELILNSICITSEK